MNRKRALLLSAAIVCAVGAGYILGRLESQPAAPEAALGAPSAASQVYTCSMHPQVRASQPGKCPICGMPLILASAPEANSGEKPTIELSDHALAMARVESVPVIRRELSRELQAVGKIQFNETSLATITARIDGYAERLFVNFTGVEINAGDHLADIYSPELLVAQQELLIALQGGASEQANSLVEIAKLKLRRWNLTEDQINALLESKQIVDRVTLRSPISGAVIEKSIVENSAFKAGDALYRIANLDTVWAYLDIYEYDLAWVRYGQRVEIVAEALPGRVFEGVVSFVEPVLNEATRAVRVPVHVENQDHALKPGMFVSARIASRLDAEGQAAPTGVEGKFACPMHPQIIADAPGQCPLCEMALKLIPADQDSPETSLPLAIPATAALDSGTRKIAFMEKSPGVFELREVVLGPRAGEFFPVLSGLAEGERVATAAGF